MAKRRRRARSGKLRANKRILRNLMSALHTVSLHNCGVSPGVQAEIRPYLMTWARGPLLAAIREMLGDGVQHDFGDHVNKHTMFPRACEKCRKETL